MKIVIPMAGLGSRFKSVGVDTPKPLISVNGKTLIEHTVESLGIDGEYIFITRKYENSKYNDNLSSILKKLFPNSIEIMLEKNQLGAADAALYAKEYINNDEELIITNCDQRLEWKAENFIKFIKDTNCDGAVVLFKSNEDKNSYAKLSGSRVVEIAEKKVISENALFGVHYWKKGSDFVWTAEKLLVEYKEKNLKECYVAETYAYLLEQKEILGYHLKNNEFHILGTPEDIDIYNAKIKEYYTEKPKTIFCDVDGTIVKHAHKFSHLGIEEAKVLEGVIDKFNEWDSKGHTIVLTTARKESARSMTESQLSSLGLCWDYLIMGVTSGERVLINDKIKESDKDRAVSINVITDSGFKDIDWKSIGL